MRNGGRERVLVCFWCEEEGIEGEGEGLGVGRNRSTLDQPRRVGERGSDAAGRDLSPMPVAFPAFVTIFFQ